MQTRSKGARVLDKTVKVSPLKTPLAILQPTAVGVRHPIHKISHIFIFNHIYR